MSLSNWLFWACGLFCLWRRNNKNNWVHNCQHITTGAEHNSSGLVVLYNKNNVHSMKPKYGLKWRDKKPDLTQTFALITWFLHIKIKDWNCHFLHCSQPQHQQQQHNPKKIATIRIWMDHHPKTPTFCYTKKQTLNPKTFTFC